MEALFIVFTALMSFGIGWASASTYWINTYETRLHEQAERLRMNGGIDVR